MVDAPRQHADLNPLRPHSFLTEPERDESGKVISVATIFLTNRPCPWHCIYCDLWKNTLTETAPPGAIAAQIDFALAQLGRDEFHKSNSDSSGIRETCPSNIKQIKLYNAGSFFDPKAIPPEDYETIAERVCRFERIIVECHPALVGASSVRFRDLLKQASAGTPPRLEVAMGLEIADDDILAKLNKRMTLEMFSRAAKFLREHDIDMRAFVMVKPPFVRTEAEALTFAQRSIDFAFECGASVVSLIPSRFGPVELTRLAERGEFAPPKLATFEAALDCGVSVGQGRVFADLWDIEKFSDCSNCFEQRQARLRETNLQQSTQPRIVCKACE